MLTMHAAFVIICIMIAIFSAVLISDALHNPFQYPCFEYSFDISGKRNVQIDDLIDMYLNKHGLSEIEEHEEQIKYWKRLCNVHIKGSIFRTWRQKQYEQCLKDSQAYVFYGVRKKKVTNAVGHSYIWLFERYRKLKKIGFETTLNNYFYKKQRGLMTKKLREKIAKRDNYTCQKCGKYMPDGVGLHIDHIIPISKGGKSVPSNLQVLCSKCNGHKSNKSAIKI